MSVLALLGVLLAPAPPSGPTTIVVDVAPRTLALHGAVTVEIRGVDARIDLRRGQEGELKWSGSLKTTAHDSETARQASRGTHVMVSTESPERIVIDLTPKEVSRATTTVELHLEVPPHAEARLKLRSGGVIATTDGPLDVQLRSGSIQTTLLGQATIRAETGRGRIEQSVGLSVTHRGQGSVADGRIGGGGATVNLKTGQGTITLRSKDETPE